MKETLRFSTVIFLTWLMTFNSALGAGATQKLSTDTMQLGLGASATTKAITIDAGLGASNPKITVPMATKDFNFNKAVKIANDLLRVGDGTITASKVIEFDIGNGATNPKMRWNVTLSSFEFSTDGTNYTAFGTGSGGGSGLNLISTNPDFEQGIANGWTNSGGTYAAATGTNILFGTGSAVFTASAGAQYVQSSLYTVPQGLAYQPCVATMWYKGGDANYTLQVVDSSSNLIAQRALEGASTYARPFSVPFNCGAAGTQYRTKLVSTAAGAIIAWDRNHLGEQSMQQLSQAQMYGTLRYTGAVNCTWTRSGAVGSFAADTDCSTPTTTGNAQAPATKIPAIKFAYLPPGSYKVTFRASQLYCASSLDCSWRITDGTNNSGYQDQNSGNAQRHHIIQYVFNYTTAQSNIQFELQAFTGDANTAQLYATTPGKDLDVDVEYFPSSQQAAFTPDTTAWRVDANIYSSGAGDISLGTGNVASYSEMGRSDLVLEQNPGSIAVGIACASGTASVVGATTCAGTRSNGLTFNLPRAGSVRACADFTHYVDLNAASTSVYAGFEMIETTASSSAIVQEGKGRVVSAFEMVVGAGINHRHDKPVRLCGTFVFDSAGQKTIRAAYEHLTTGTIISSTILASRYAGYGQPDIHWTVEPLDQPSPMPVMVGPYAQTTAVKTGAYSMVPSDDIVQADTTSSAFNITLPSAATAGIGKVVRIVRVNTSTNLLGVTGSIAGTVRTTYLHAKSENISFMSDGSSWQWLSDPWRTEAVNFGCGTGFGTGAITSNTGAWVTGTLTQTATGSCAVNFVTGIFNSGSNVYCTGTVIPSTTTDSFMRLGTVSTSSAAVLVFNSAGTAINEPIMLNCRGQR